MIGDLFFFSLFNMPCILLVEKEMNELNLKKEEKND
jgi:hypothetical protein